MVVLILVAAVALVVVVLTWRESTSPDALRDEAAKTAMQVLAVSVVGGAAGFAWKAWQDERASKERTAATQRLTRQENYRREVERIRHDRELDDQHKLALLRETLQAYNRLKRTRRLLKAYTYDGNERGITRGVYDNAIEEIMNEQLLFEEYLRLAKSSASPLPQEATTSFDSIQSYLNKIIIKEYQRKRETVDESRPTPLSELPGLSGFIDLVEPKFTSQVSPQIDLIITAIYTALARPLELQNVPDPGHETR